MVGKERGGNLQISPTPATNVQVHCFPPGKTKCHWPGPCLVAELFYNHFLSVNWLLISGEAITCWVPNQLASQVINSCVFSFTVWGRQVVRHWVSQLWTGTANRLTLMGQTPLSGTNAWLTVCVYLRPEIDNVLLLPICGSVLQYLQRQNSHQRLSLSLEHF